MGRFVILGSAQPTLVRHVVESLAGRVGILELPPLTVQEASTGGAPVADYRQVWLSGGYPDALAAAGRGGHFRDWWEAYLRTYVERDLPTLDVLDNHSIRGASWETFVLEDLLRREAVAYPHSLAHFWRTAGGAEVDMLFERGGALHALEIKTARASSPYLARGVTRCGFCDSVTWLPGNVSRN